MDSQVLIDTIAHDERLSAYEKIYFRPGRGTRAAQYWQRHPGCTILAEVSGVHRLRPYGYTSLHKQGELLMSRVSMEVYAADAV